MSTSLENLQQRICELEDELEEKTENLCKAAEFGKSLLSTNQLLNDKLDARETEYSKQLEVIILCTSCLFRDSNS